MHRAPGEKRTVHLGNDDVTIQALVDLWVALDADQAMLLGVVQPVTCAAYGERVGE